MTRMTVNLAAALALSGPLCLAQQMLSSVAGNITESPSATASSVNAASQTAPKASLTGRWLDLTAFSHAERYRNAFALGGVHNFDSAQSRSLIAGTVKIDRDGRYRVGFSASSGRYFNWAFSTYTGQTWIDRVNTDAFRSTYFTPPQLGEVVNALFSDPTGFALTSSGGIESNGWQFYLRQLYFSATPVRPLTVEAGSFGIERGLSTEITSFDEDGYLTGERVRVRSQTPVRGRDRLHQRLLRRHRDRQPLRTRFQLQARQLPPAFRQ